MTRSLPGGRHGVPTPDGSGRWVKSKNPAGQPAVKREEEEDWGPSEVPSARSRSSLGASASGELLSRPRYRGQTHFRAVNRDQVGHRRDRPDQANRDHDGDSNPCAHLHPLYVALSWPIEGSHIFSPPQCEVVHRFENFF
jgi:hypothetical protein